MRNSKKGEMNNNSIVFVNSPVSSKNEDVIGFNDQVNTIINAINENATMIGIIADYGTGKSSMTEMLKEKYVSEGNPKPIKINMWDSLTKEDEQNSQNAVSVLTKSFLFQLANGYNRHLGSHVNKMLSRNYGSISFSSNHYVRFFTFLILSLVCFALFRIGGISGTGVMKYLPEWFEGCASFYKLVSPAFLVLLIVFAVIGIKNICIAFSHWKMPANRNPEISDVFDIYRLIIEEIKPKKGKKQLILIDDLDRIQSKDIVIEFLKELYRFQDAIEEDKSSFVFVISVMPESRLCSSDKYKEQKLFSKLFDTTIFLKPIHYDDYDSILIRLIDSDENKKKELERLIGETINSVLPESFKWIKRGTNLTLRDLKERLNKAVSIMVSLVNRSYEGNSAAKFQSCTAVSYLEHQFSNDFYNLIQNEKAFALFIEKCVPLINSTNGKNLDTFLSVYDESFKETKAPFSDDFKVDLCSMIIDGIFDDDFRMYFYTYPRGSHIKTTAEREICDYLLFPNINNKYEAISESVNNAYSKGENATIDKVIRSLDSYPIVLLKNDTLFLRAAEISISKLFVSFNKNCIEHMDFVDDDIDIWKRLLLLKNEKRKYFFIKTTDRILETGNTQSLLIFRRKLVIALEKEISLLSNLFINEETPIITQEEMELINDPFVSIPLINIEKLSEDDFEYISNVITSVPLKEESTQIMDTALCVLKEYKNTVGIDADDSILLFLKINHHIDDELFDCIYESIEDEELVEYLNSFEANELSDKYLDAVNRKCILQGLSDDIIENLFSKDLFATGLAHYSLTSRLNEFNQFQDKCNEILAECDSINLKDPSVIICIRKQTYAVLGIDAYSELFFGHYPIITEEEYLCIEPAERAIILLDLNRIEENDYQLVKIASKREYSTDELLTLFYHLFGDDSDEISDEISSNILESLDFTALNTKRLSFDQRNTFYSLVSDIISIQNEKDEIIGFLRRFGGFIPALEESIQDSDEYSQLMQSFDELSDKSLQWLDENYITCSLSENLCGILYERKDYQNYIIATVLREGHMIIDQSIPETDYLKVYRYSCEAMFNIMSEHWDFLEIFQQKADFCKYEKKHLLPVFKTKQYARFFKYIDTLDNEIKTEYFNTFGKLASIEDSKAFRKLVCKKENMELLGDRKTYYHIKEQLWDDAPQEKAQFTRVWNQRWKEELSSKEE